MTFQEKSTWVTAVSLIVANVWYFTAIGGQIATTRAADIAYQRPLIVLVGVSVVMVVIGTTLAALLNPAASYVNDERDKSINRLGEYVGGYMLGAGAMVALVLAMLELDHFWIAHAIMAALVLSELVTVTTKLVAYRRGL